MSLLAVVAVVVGRRFIGAFVSFIASVSAYVLSGVRRKERLHPFYRIIDSPGRAAASIGVAAFLSAAAVSLLVRAPVPSAHDEFSYLLAADTFARGRLTNPPHPLWTHFESMHVIQTPTYASKYPPAQGLALAAGQALAGRPIVGVWLSFALMCAVLCWMLQGWVPARWAFLGAGLAACRIGFVGQAYDMGLFGYWSQSYWGGAVAGMGGALVFGSLRRLWDRPSVALSAVLALGLAVLANARPYEGFLTALPAAGALVYWWFKKKEVPRSVKAVRVFLPLAVFLAAAFSWIGYYNWRVTGDPLTMPYQVHERAYAAAPYFHWMPLPPEPVYRHKAIRDFQVGWWKQYYTDQKSAVRFAAAGFRKLGNIWVFYLGALLTLPFLFSFRAVKMDPWVRWAFFVCCFVVLGMFPITHMPLPHYSAPIMCLIYLLLIEGVRVLYGVRWRGRRWGANLVYLTVAASFLSVVFPLTNKMYSVIPNWSFAEDRQAVAERLERTDGRHLVVVRYAPDHNPNAEWVYNGADIDQAKVVWAREIDDPDAMRRLIAHFNGRMVWLLEADKDPVEPALYSGLPRTGREAGLKNGTDGFPGGVEEK